MTENTSMTVVLQRVRNGMIDWLEDVASGDAKRLAAYLPGMPRKVGVELVELWSCFVAWPATARDLPEPVFSRAEIKVLKRVETALNFAFAKMRAGGTLENNSPAILLASDIWRAVQTEAVAALEVLMARGRLSDEVEASPSDLGH
jgi:hypothetical protein